MASLHVKPFCFSRAAAIGYPLLLLLVVVVVVVVRVVRQQHYPEYLVKLLTKVHRYMIYQNY